jgi:hypothetical protein
VTFNIWKVSLLRMKNIRFVGKKLKNKKNSIDQHKKIIQGVSEIHVLILTSERTCKFIKVFSITFCKIPNNFQDFLRPNFYQTSLCFFVTMRILIFIIYFSITM